MTQPFHLRERNMVTSVPETVWAPELVLKNAENLDQTRIRTPALPVRSDLLYRMNHLGPPFAMCSAYFFFLSNAITSSRPDLNCYLCNVEW
jgi:hypothetical protein